MEVINKNHVDERRHEHVEEIVKVVMERLRKGQLPEEVASALVLIGLEHEDSIRIVSEIVERVKEVARSERPDFVSLLKGAVGGIIGAVVGGVLWFLFVVLTETEWGAIASLIGLFSGASVVFFSGGKKGVAIQAISMFYGIVGIILGRYLVAVYFLKRLIAQEYGEGIASIISYFFLSIFIFHKKFSPYRGYFRYFMGSISSLFCVENGTACCERLSKS